jgi:alpha-glucosidase (family GH31 glycosyl hydrolase)
MIRRCVITVALACLSASALSQSGDSSSIRHHGSTIICQRARFQFLSADLVRIEYSPSGSFVDVPTAIVTNRNWPSVHVDVSRGNGSLVARTARLTVKYMLSSGPFDGTNLTVSWKQGGSEHSWTPGDIDTQNLGGISRSLDGARTGRLPAFEPGLLSKSGYFLLDDSRTPVWDQQTQWITPRPETGTQDLYFCAYGLDYRHGLKNYTELCGKIPMIPRYVLGGWVTDLNYEYLPGTDLVEKYRYSDRDIKEMVERFRSEDIPIDVLILDFAWHRFGWKGGYDWSPIFPNPTEFLRWAHDQGLRVSLNDHPGYGKESVLSDEDSHADQIRKVLQIPTPPRATFNLDVQKDWKFKIDPAGAGTEGRWQAPTLNDSGWQTLQAGTAWEEQGFPDYDGVAWYRKHLRIPAATPSGKLYIVFGGVDDEYDLFVNGTLVAHHGSPGNSVYDLPTATDISTWIKHGEENLVALRVNDWGGAGGISAGPVAITDVPPAPGIRFNLADKRQAEAFMTVLHNPLIDQGVDFWWIDGGSGCAEMEGLSSQMWTNHVYYRYTEEHTKKRAFVFSRFGGWGNHRYPSVFTGDTYSEWNVLACEVPYTARGGNVLAPYVTHDIGGFLGKKLDLALYVRWVQFGVFSPILRLHSAFENPRDGNLRLPWNYGDKGVEIARDMFRLRYRLLPYIYTYSRLAYDEGLPIVRPLYLEYPNDSVAYARADEYLFGSEFLVAPIVDSTGERDVYLPSGMWSEYFSGENHRGEATIHIRCPLERIPLFVRSGSIIPQQPVSQHAERRNLDTLIADVYGPQPGKFELYEDDGVSLDYLDGKFARTPLSFNGRKGEGYAIEIGPTGGRFNGQVERRAYTLMVHGLSKPSSVSVNGKKLGQVSNDAVNWRWEETKGVIVIQAGQHSIRKALEIRMRK